MLPQISNCKYKAFISYSHADEKWAKWLHKALESYSVNRRLVGKETRAGIIPKKLSPIFRDRDELASATDLSAEINSALSQSSALIVICSRSSAQSHWVNEEIKAYKRLGGAERVFCLIVDGEPYASEKPGEEADECFPVALRYKLDERGGLSDIPAEPIASDVRPGKDGKDNAKIKLIAGLLAVGFDDLRQREMLRRQRRLAAIASGAVAGMVVAVGLATAAVMARNEAQVQRTLAEAEAKTARQTANFMVELFSVSDPSEARGNTITAREILDQAARRIENELASEPKIQATLMGTIGNVYTSLGLYTQARPMLKNALEMRREIIETTPMELAVSMNSFARLMTEQADYDEAEKLYQESIGILRSNGADVELHNSYAGLAELYYRMGRYEDSEPLLRQVLSFRREYNGPQSPEVADATEELGLNYFDQGNLEQAEVLLKQSLALWRKIYSTGIHPDLSVNINNLASLYYKSGDLDAAGELLRESLDMSKKMFGDVHPDVAAIYNNLAFLYHDQGKLDPAEEMYREALTQKQLIYAESHPEVARSLNNLAYLIYEKGNLDEAVEMASRALAIARETLGSQHLDVATYAAVTARWLAEAGKYAAAIDMLREALAVKSLQLEPDHPSLVVTQMDLAEALCSQGMLGEAQSLSADTYQLQRELRGESDWVALAAASVYGAVLSQQGRITEAEPLLKTSYEGLSVDTNVRPVFKTKAIKRLIEHYQRSGARDKVARLEALL